MIFTVISFGSFAQIRYQGEAHIGFGFGVGTYNKSRANIETVHGVRLGDYFFVGAGVGAHIYRGYFGDANTKPNFIIPIFGNLKGYLLESKVTPMISVNIGHGVGTGDFAGEGGFYIEPAVGIAWKVGQKNNAINFTIGFQSQNINTDRKHYGFNAIALKVGFTF